MLTRMKAPMEHYLRPSFWLDYNSEPIQETVLKLVPPTAGKTHDEVETARILFEFVRDRIRHSYDARLDTITATASDTLIEGHGICYAKSHLLAALLRACGIPSGLCYQRLTLFDTPESGFCIHALNTAFLRPLNRWIRLDARGNKPGVNAQFSLDAEQLAFPVREPLGEIDYPANYCDPHPLIVRTLTANRSGIAMYEQYLPTSLPDEDRI